jgi:hypothetical protein
MTATSSQPVIPNSSALSRRDSRGISARRTSFRAAKWHFALTNDHIATPSEAKQFPIDV